MRLINETGAQPLSDAGRRVLEDELRHMLRQRANMALQRDRAISDAFGHVIVLGGTAKRCKALCEDLGYASEEEAAADLLVAESTDQVSNEGPQIVEVKFDGEQFVETKR